MTGPEELDSKVPDTIRQLAEREQVLVHSPDGRLWLIARGKLNGCWRPATEGDRELASEFLEALRTSAADLRAWTVVGPFIQGGGEGVALDAVAALAPPGPIVPVSDHPNELGQPASPAAADEPPAVFPEPDPPDLEAQFAPPAAAPEPLAPSAAAPAPLMPPAPLPAAPAQAAPPGLEPHLVEMLRDRLLAIAPVTAVVDRVMAVTTGPGDVGARIAELERMRGERYLFCSPTVMAQLVKVAIDTLQSLVRHQRR